VDAGLEQGSADAADDDVQADQNDGEMDFSLPSKKRKRKNHQLH